MKNIAKVLISVSVVATMVFATACVGDLKYDDPYSKYNLDDYVELGKYEGIEVTKPEVKVTKEEVKAEIDARVADKTTEEHKKSGTAESGDKVNISYVGKKDGKAFEGGSTGKGGTDIVLGASGYIAGFDDGVIGMKVGETKDLNLTFPEDYHEKSLAGQPVVFTVTLNYIIVPKTVKYDMDFIKSVSKAKSKKDYEAEVKKELEKKKEATAKNAMYGTLWNAIMDNAKIKKYPKEQVERAQKEEEEQLKQYAAQYNMSLDDLIKNMMQMDKEQYKKYAEEEAKRMVAQEMVFSKILQNEKIKLTNSEYKTRLKELKEEQGIDDEEFKKASGGKTFEESVDKNKLIRAFLIDKVCEDALSKAKVK